MSYVQFGFLNNMQADSIIQDAIDGLIIRKKEDSAFRNRICFADYSTAYSKDKDFYLAMQIFPQIYEFIEFFNSVFSNIKITVISANKIYHYISSNSNGWDEKEKSFEPKEDTSPYMITDHIFVKITVSEKYNKLARYLVIFMTAVILRMFNKDENFIKPDVDNKDNPKVDLDYLMYILSMRRGNSNHLLYCDSTIRVTTEVILLLDDVEFCNKAFENNFSERGDLSFWKISIDTRPSQTAVFNHMIKAAGLPFKENTFSILYYYTDTIGQEIYSCMGCHSHSLLKDFGINQENIGTCPICKSRVEKS